MSNPITYVKGGRIGRLEEPGDISRAKRESGGMGSGAYSNETGPLRGRGAALHKDMRRVTESAHAFPVQGESNCVSGRAS